MGGVGDFSFEFGRRRILNSLFNDAVGTINRDLEIIPCPQSYPEIVQLFSVFSVWVSDKKGCSESQF